MGRGVRRWTVRGPLVPWASGFERWLTGRGYSPSVVDKRMWLLASLSRWLEREGFDAGGLTVDRAELFLAERRAARRANWVSPRSLSLPLEYLREVGAVPLEAAVAAEGPLEELLDEYRRYLAL